MKILIYSDPHWCSYSSIIRSRGIKYTTRLENEINTFNWIEEIAVNNNCDAIFNLGDTFDQSFLKDEELTALRDIKWSNISHIFLVGNHEMGRADLEFSSVHFLQLCPRLSIIDKPSKFDIDSTTELCFIPYMLDTKDVKINDLFGVSSKNRYVFSHNDIAGVQMGKFKSVEGLDLNDISSNCKMFFNGHLHNCSYVKDNVLNVGNITGQNFSEDASIYSHNCYILDTKDNSLVTIENPYAFNFYKLDYKDLSTDEIKYKLNNIKNNAVVSLTCDFSIQSEVNEILKLNNNIIESRLLVNRKVDSNDSENSTLDSVDFSVDHLKYFSEFILNNVGSDDLVKEELEVILK